MSDFSVGQRLKDWAKLRLFPSRLKGWNYETCLDERKIAVLLDKAADALTAYPGGAFLEFGVARGGATCMLSNAIIERGAEARLFSFDTFDGFDPDEWNRSVRSGAVSDASVERSFHGIGIRYVSEKLRVLGLDGPVQLVQGYFQETLGPMMPKIGRVSLCFIDCDLPDSVTFCAESVWPALETGGYMLFDDYMSPEYGIGVRRAVDAFVAALPTPPNEAGEAGGLYVLRK